MKATPDIKPLSEWEGVTEGGMVISGGGGYIYIYIYIYIYSIHVFAIPCVVYVCTWMFVCFVLLGMKEPLVQLYGSRAVHLSTNILNATI